MQPRKLVGFLLLLAVLIADFAAVFFYWHFLLIESRHNQGLSFRDVSNQEIISHMLESWFHVSASDGIFDVIKNAALDALNIVFVFLPAVASLVWNSIATRAVLLTALILVCFTTSRMISGFVALNAFNVHLVGISPLLFTLTIFAALIIVAVRCVVVIPRCIALIRDRA